jgi:outer membrane protein/protease secretion system outer membrane protein
VVRHASRLLVLLAVAAAGSAHALNLAEAYQRAQARDPQVRAARAAAEATRERIPQARSQLLPQAVLNLQRTRNDLRSQQPGFQGTTVSEHRHYDSENHQLTVRQPLYKPQATAQLRQARALVEGGEATLEREEQALVMRLTQAYLEALQAEEQLRLVGVQRAAYTGQLEAARRGFAGGTGIRTDIDEAQARLDLNVADELGARQAVEYTRRQLGLIIGEPVTSLSPVAVDRMPLAVPQPARLEDWLARAEAASPDIRAAQAQLAAAREDVRRAQAGHLPTLDAIGQISRSDSDNPTRVDTKYNLAYIGLQLNVPLYQGGLVSSQVRQALAEVERLESVVDATRQELSVRVHREFRGVTEGIARVRALEQAVRSGEQLVTSRWQPHDHRHPECGTAAGDDAARPRAGALHLPAVRGALARAGGGDARGEHCGSERVVAALSNTLHAGTPGDDSFLGNAGNNTIRAAWSTFPRSSAISEDPPRSPACAVQLLAGSCMIAGTCGHLRALAGTCGRDARRASRK